MLQWTQACIYLVRILFSFPLEVRLLEHMVVLSLIFWGLSVAVSMAIPLALLFYPQWQGFPFSTYPPTLYYLSFDDSHYYRYLIVVLICIPWCLVMCWVPFLVPVGHLYIFFGKKSAQILCPFFNWVFFSVEFFMSFLHILDTNSCHIQNLQMFSAIL